MASYMDYAVKNAEQTGMLMGKAADAFMGVEDEEAAVERLIRDSDMSTEAGRAALLKAVGKISPDAMMLLAEPVMYTIMAIGEEANIKYNIEGNDLDEFDDEDDAEDFDNKVNEFRNVLSDIKKGATKNIEPSKIDTNVVPESILAQVKEKGPEIKSLLSKGEE